MQRTFSYLFCLIFIANGPASQQERRQPKSSGEWYCQDVAVFASSVGFSFFLCVKVLPFVLSRSKVGLPAKSGNGISLLIKAYRRHMTRQRLFLCRAFGYTSMVGWAGASQDAPVSDKAGKANPVQSATRRLASPVVV